MAVCWSASCGEASRDPKEVRLGLLALLQGIPRETSGVPSQRAAELAVSKLNHDGGVLIGGEAHRVVLVVKGYEDRADSATNEARALINQDRVDAIIGPQFSRHAIAVSKVAEDARVPMVSPLSSSPETTEGKEFVFRLAFLDDVQGAVMGRFAAEELAARRAAVLYEVSSAYGSKLAAVFSEAFEGNGGSIVAYESFARDEPLDFRERLTRIREQEPDVLYLPSDTRSVAAQILQARELGLDITTLGGDMWDIETFKRMPECDGSYVAHQWHPSIDTSEAREFVAEYRAAYSETPRVAAALTYDAVLLLARAIERAGSKGPEDIRRELAATGDFSGAGGSIRFRGTPDPVRSVVISKFEASQNKLYRIVDPE